MTTKETFSERETFRTDFLLQNGGEMTRLVSEFDWSNTSIGPFEEWPQSLRTTLSIILSSKFPMFLFWGPEQLCFYNDAYRPSLGNEGKHPMALGSRGEDVWPEIWHIIKPFIDKAITEGDATWKEDQLIPIYRNGKIQDVYWTFSYSPVIDESGLPNGVLVTCVETTENIRTLNDIKESKNQLEFALEAAELGTWDLNVLTNKLTGNSRLMSWFGVKHTQEIDLDHLIKAITARDRHRVVAAIEKALSDPLDGHYNIDYTIQNLITHEQKILRAKGRVWFDDENKPLRFNGTVQDITLETVAKKELKENKQRLELAIEIAELGVFTVDLSTNTATYNDRVIHWFGLSKQNLTLKEVFSCIHPEDRDFVAETIMDSVAMKSNGRHDVVYRVINQKSNEMKYVRSFGQVQLSSKVPVSIAGIIQDVTAQVETNNKIKESEERFRALAEQLEHKNAQLLRTNNDLDNFIYTASHDLKAPISNIEGLVNALSRSMEESREPSEKVKQFMSMIHTSIEKFKHTLLDLTEIAKVQSNLEEDQSEIYFSEILEEVKFNIQNLIDDSKTRIMADFSRVPAIYFSRKNLRSIIYNLVSNAIKYRSPERPSHISITSRAVENDYILLSVQDNGMGIREEDKAKVFTMFKRLHHGVEGTGIGLSIVKKIIDNNGGKIEIDSEIDKGTNFMIYFKTGIEI